MLKNSEIPPGTYNQWIDGIKQFDFTLVHIPVSRHKAPDALSRQRYTTDNEDDTERSDLEDWIESLAFAAQINLGLPTEAASKVGYARTSQAIISPPHQTPSFPLINDSSFMEPRPKMAQVAVLSHTYTDRDMEEILRYLVTSSTPRFKTTRDQLHFQSKVKPFYLKEAHMYKQNPGHPSQVIIFTEERHKAILWEMHEDSAHHRAWAVKKQITLCYFWPDMLDHIKEHVQSCHPCQLRSTKKMHIPITVSHPPALFSKVYLDVMKMPKARGKEWLIGC